MSSLFSKALVYLGLVDEDQIDETPTVDQYVATPEPAPAATPEPQPRRVEPPGRRVEPPPTGRTALRPQPREDDTSVEVRPVEVQSDILVVEEFADARTLADRVRQRVPVILDLRHVDSETSRRVIDFSSGLIYALDGAMRKVGDGLIAVLPNKVTLSRDEKRRLAGLGAYELDDIDD